MSNAYTHPYSGQQGPGSSYPPQQPGQRFPTYQPRGQGPQQNMTRAPHYFHPAMGPHGGRRLNMTFPVFNCDLILFFFLRNVA